MGMRDIKALWEGIKEDIDWEGMDRRERLLWVVLVLVVAPGMYVCGRLRPRWPMVK
jgi:hypothetical protein